MSDPTPRVFRIAGAQVISLSPLVVRQRASADVLLRIDGEEALPLESGQILLCATAHPGPVDVPANLPVEGYDLGPELVELCFLGAVTARVEGRDLVVETDATLVVGGGEGFLPYDRAQVEGASLVSFECEQPPQPHQPRRQP